MTRIALIYGALSGAIIMAVTIAMIVLAGDNADHSSPLVGYLIMIVALTMIFIGVKRYRDRDLGGVIKFWPAFGLGLGIAVVAGIVYVAVWEAYLYATHYDFINQYASSVIEAKREAGASGAELDKLTADMDSLIKNYANPLFRLPMTFLEIFPVGLIIAIISAALLRNPKLLPARG